MPISSLLRERESRTTLPTSILFCSTSFCSASEIPASFIMGVAMECANTSVASSDTAKTMMVMIVTERTVLFPCL